MVTPSTAGSSYSALSAPLTLKNPFRTKIPKLVYGTAWKNDRTADLVYQALKAGFKAIDMAAQPRHYQENLVGQGIRKAINEGIVSREDLYIQTKFTPLSGQTRKICHIVRAIPSLTESDRLFASSFSNLRTSENAEDTYIDCLVLHSPLPTIEQTHEAWSTLETFVPNNIRFLGISNATLTVINFLHAEMEIPPCVVQKPLLPRHGLGSRPSQILQRGRGYLSVFLDLIRKSNPTGCKGREAASIGG